MHKFPEETRRRTPKPEAKAANHPIPKKYPLRSNTCRAITIKPNAQYLCAKTPLETRQDSTEADL
jgi:hypothetical protein